MTKPGSIIAHAKVSKALDWNKVPKFRDLQAANICSSACFVLSVFPSVDQPSRDLALRITFTVFWWVLRRKDENALQALDKIQTLNKFKRVLPVEQNGKNAPALLEVSLKKAQFSRRPHLKFIFVSWLQIP